MSVRHMELCSVLRRCGRESRFPRRQLHQSVDESIGDAELLHVDEGRRKPLLRLGQLQSQFIIISIIIKHCVVGRTNVLIQKYGCSSGMQALEPSNIVHLGVDDNPLLPKSIVTFLNC